MVAMLVLLTSSRLFGQTRGPREQEVARAWYALLAQMECGPLAATKELLSETAYASLVNEARTTEHVAVIREFAATMKNAPLRVHLLSSTEAFLDLGEEDLEVGIYSSGVVLEYKKGKWCLVAFFSAK